MTATDSTFPREVWLVRHGVTEANRQRAVQGHSDVPLAAEGVRQAEQLADDLVGRRVEFGCIVSSTLQRARHTAEALAARLGIAVREEPDFREANYGDWEGGSFEVVTAGRARHGGEPFTCAPPGGESIVAMGERAARAFDSWAGRPGGAPRLLVVTHGGPIAALVCRVLGLPHTADAVRRFRRDNAGVTVLRRRRSDPATFRLALLNGTEHLRPIE